MASFGAKTGDFWPREWARMYRVFAQVEPSPACLAAVGRMAACPACQGLPATRPCPGLCLNTMKGCLAHHYGVDDLWAKFTGKRPSAV